MIAASDHKYPSHPADVFLVGRLLPPQGRSMPLDEALSFASETPDSNSIVVGHAFWLAMLGLMPQFWVCSSESLSPFDLISKLCERGVPSCTKHTHKVDSSLAAPRTRGPLHKT